jgi:hypothetical protein
MSVVAGVAALRVRTRPGTAPARSAASLVAMATALALTGSAGLVWLAGQPSTGAAVRSGPHGVAAWMMTSLLTLPVVIGGFWVSKQLSRLVRGAIGARPLSVTANAVVVSGATSTGLGTGWHLQTTFAGADPPVGRLFFAVVLASPVALLVTLLLTAVVAGLTDRSPRLQASQKSFDVSSIDVDISLNRFGDHDPLGRYFAGDLRRIVTTAGTWGLQRMLPQPLACPTTQLLCLDTGGTP